MSKPNPFEQSARAARVVKLLSLLPTAYSAVDIEAQARELESWDQAARDRWGSHVGAERPSVETWRQFVAASRARKLPDEYTPVDKGKLLFIADAKGAR